MTYQHYHVYTVKISFGKLYNKESKLSYHYHFGHWTYTPEKSKEKYQNIKKGEWFTIILNLAITIINMIAII